MVIILHITYYILHISYLFEKKIRIFDYPQFVQSLLDALIAHVKKQETLYTMRGDAFLDMGDLKKSTRTCQQ